MINPQSVQTLILGIQDNLTTLANSLGSLGDSFELHLAGGLSKPLIDADGRVWVPNGFNTSSYSSNPYTGVRDLYPMYPYLWSTAFSTSWTFTLPVPNGVYQLAYWWLNPDDNNGFYEVKLTLNGTIIQDFINIYTYCGGAKLAKRVVYPTFQVVNNTPIVFKVNEAENNCPITAFEVYKIGEIP